jgi:hypothetical protein
MTVRVESFLKDSTQSSFENIIFTGIFAMSATGKIDVNRSFKKYQLEGLFKTNCLLGTGQLRERFDVRNLSV